jgi:hypothetical protein
MSEFVGDFGGLGFGGGGFGGGGGFDWGSGFSSFGTTAEPAVGGGGDFDPFGGSTMDTAAARSSEFDPFGGNTMDATKPDWFDRLGTWASSDKGQKALTIGAGAVGKMLGSDKSASQPWPAAGSGAGQGEQSKGTPPNTLNALIQALLAKRQAQTTAYLQSGSMQPRSIAGLLGGG